MRAARLEGRAVRRMRQLRRHDKVAAAVVTQILLLAGASLTLGASAVPSPVFGQSVDVAPLKGKVTVKLPGQPSKVLSLARLVPVGTTVDASSGSAGVTASDGKGSVYSGRFSDGSFQVLQTALGGGATVIKLVGACVKSSMATDRAAANTARRRPHHRAPVYRQLQVVASSQFEVIGNDASAVASGQAQYLLTDKCDGTHVVAQTGQITATSRSTGTYRLKPHQSLIDDCRPPGPEAKICTLLVARPGSSAFSFGLLLVGSAATTLRVCYVTPKGRRLCYKAPLSQPDAAGAQAGGLACTINDGRGVYAVRWFVGGRQVGVLHRFTSTQPPDVSLGSDTCYPLSL